MIIEEEKLYEEFSHSVYDAQKKVNIFDLSSSLNVDMKGASNVLLNWLNQQKETLNMEYLVSYYETDGSVRITIVNGLKDLEEVKKKFGVIYEVLFSVEKGKSSYSFHEIDRPKFKNIKLAINLQKAEDSVIEEINDLAKKSDNDFQEKAEMGTFDKENIKKTKNIPSMFNSKGKETKKMFTKVSPKKEIENPTIKTTTNTENVSTIKSFFAKKDKSPISTKKIKNEPEKSDQMPTKNNKSDSSPKDKSPLEEHSNNETSESEPEIKKKTPIKKTRKRHRVIVMNDSSDEELNEEQNQNNNSDENLEAPQQNIPSPPDVKREKRIVTKTYEDADGYIITVKESEDYIEKNDKKPENQTIQPKNNMRPKESVKKSEKQSTKKQESIMKFFSKK